MSAPKALCRAIKKQPILYDQSHEHYRKRLPSENCWDLVASEVSESVEKCKRRWRQIRNDYVRWISSDEHRHRNGQKRPTFYLADDLKFLKPHLSLAEPGSECETDSPVRERDSKSKSKEPALEEYKAKPKDEPDSLAEQPQTKVKQTAAVKAQTEADKNKDKEKDIKKEEKKQPQPDDKDKQIKVKANESETEDGASEEDNSSQNDDKELSEGTATPTTSSVASAPSACVSPSVKQPEFFIKQSNKSPSSNCLIIGKKPPARAASPDRDPLFEPMADDSGDETSSLGGGRRLRRGATRLKQLPIHKAASEQRLTRLQRRKSMTVAAANSLRSSTSPVKMTPVPRPSLAANAAQAKTLAKIAPKPAASSSSRDDIFPRPRAVAPTAQQVVLARRPGAVHAQQQQQQQQPQQQQLQPTPQMRPFGVPRSPAPAGMAKRLLSTAPGPRVSFASPPGQRAAAASPAATTQAKQQQQQQQQQQRLVSSSNTLVISTTNCPVGSSSASTVGSASCASGANSTQTASITASPIVSAGAPMLTLIKRCERGNQTESQDIFSDEHFLELVRPQMREMNPRQKIHFKQKIFQALMEIFDDATDFPASGEVQHFNINTPSGFDHVSDGELRLIRELVSMVSAAKHSPDPQPSAASSAASPAVSSAPAQQRGLAGKFTSVVQRVFKPGHGPNPSPSSSPSPGPIPASGDEKKLYRILQMNNQATLVAGVNAPSAAQRTDSVDSNSSAASTSAGSRVGTFIVPGNSPKMGRVQDPLSGLYTAGQGKLTPASVSKEPLLVRQMGRRYSVCGGGGGAAGGNPNAMPGGATGAHLDPNMLKRRLAPAAQTMVPPQQRPRYSHSPGSVAGNHIAAIAPGNSLLMRRVANGATRQVSPPGGGSVPQRMPQIASIQGSAFNEFVTPSSVRGSPSGASSSSSTISPLKRSMIVANVKATGQQKPAAPLVRPQLVVNTSGQVKQQPSSSSSSSTSSSSSSPSQLPSPGANVANLLGDVRAQSHSQSPIPSPSSSSSSSQAPPPPPARWTGSEQSETAGIIAADDFDMGRLKREPQDIMDEQDEGIMGM